MFVRFVLEGTVFEYLPILWERDSTTTKKGTWRNSLTSKRNKVLGDSIFSGERLSTVKRGHNRSGCDC